MDHLRRALMLLCAGLALWVSPAWGGYASALAPAGFGGSVAQWTYKRAANEQWLANGTVRTNAALNVGGRMATMPASMQLAANAAEFAVSALRLTPAGLVTAAVAAWLLPYGIEWLEDQWQVRTSSPQQGYFWSAAYEGCEGLTPNEEMIKCGLEKQHGVSEWSNCFQSTGGGGDSQRWGCTYTPNAVRLEQWLTRTWCPEGQVWIGGRLCGAASEETYRPASDEDWAPVIAAPLPVPVADDIGDVIPLPVELPRINPDANPWPQPVVVPTGAPVPVPGTDPQKYDQPLIDVRPMPTPTDPWRVDVVPRVERGEDPEGVPDVTPSTPAPAPEPAPGLCELNPQAAACQPLGDAGQEPELPEHEVGGSITPVEGFGASTAACPAPRTATLAGGLQIAMPFDLFCEFADGVRPIVIAMAWLSAAVAFAGLARRGSA